MGNKCFFLILKVSYIRVLDRFAIFIGAVQGQVACRTDKETKYTEEGN